MWRPSHLADGRWQRGAVIGGLYLAGDEDTTWAEWYRSLAESGVPPDQSLPRDLWMVDLDIEVADLSTPGSLADFDLEPPVPDRETWDAYQDLGERLHGQGWAGVVGPSAARPEGLVLCIFWGTEGLPRVTPVPPPRRWVAAPAPPRGLRT